MSHSPVPTVRSGRSFLEIAASALLCFLATMVSPEVEAKTRLEVLDASFELRDEVYELDSNLDLHLPKEARAAIDAGLTLRLDYEVEILRSRRYWLDAGVAALVQSYELNYHALSQRYLLRNLNTGAQQDFSTIEAALDRLTTLRRLPVIDATLLEEGSTYEIRVRANADLSTVPDALKWLLFWTDEWSGDSEWYSWTVRL
jgi:hypothetical protein